MEHITVITEPAITEQEAQIMTDFAKLEDAEKILMFEVLKVLAAGDSLESAFVRQPCEYKQILTTLDCGHLFDAIPLMRYVQARGEGWGELFTLAMAYRIGQADGIRQNRTRRAAGKKVPA